MIPFITYRAANYCVWDCGDHYTTANEQGVILDDDIVSFNKTDTPRESFGTFFTPQPEPVQLREPGDIAGYSVFD